MKQGIFFYDLTQKITDNPKNRSALMCYKLILSIFEINAVIFLTIIFSWLTFCHVKEYTASRSFYECFVKSDTSNLGERLPYNFENFSNLPPPSTTWSPCPKNLKRRQIPSCRLADTRTRGRDPSSFFLTHKDATAPLWMGHATRDCVLRGVNFNMRYVCSPRDSSLTKKFPMGAKLK